jgi:hypothetical protein
MGDDVGVFKFFYTEFSLFFSLLGRGCFFFCQDKTGGSFPPLLFSRLSLRRSFGECDYSYVVFIFFIYFWGRFVNFFFL